jgi:hypothetical protein
MAEEHRMATVAISRSSWRSVNARLATNKGHREPDAGDRPDGSTIKVWRDAGLLIAHRYNDRGECLYEQPGPDAPVMYKHQQEYKHQHKTRGQYAQPPSTSARSSR